MMNWESWPDGRSGPLVSDIDKRLAVDCFYECEGARNEWLQRTGTTEERVWHVAEVTGDNREIFNGHVTEVLLAERLLKPHPDFFLRLLFATSQRSWEAVFSTYSKRVFAACSAPAGVWTTLVSGTASSFHSFIETTGNTFKFHGWISLRCRWKPTRDALELLSEPYLSDMRGLLSAKDDTTVHPKLYFSFDSSSQQTTIITTDLNMMHLQMISTVRASSQKENHPVEIGFRMLAIWFASIQAYFRRAATKWESDAIGRAEARTLTSDPYHEARVREAEANSTAIDITTNNMHMLRAAIKEAGVQWRTVAGLAHITAGGLAAEFDRLDMNCMETQNALVGLVGKYDRFLNLLIGITNMRMVEGLKAISEENAKITLRMKELAESNFRQAEESAKQADAMARLAYDTKRDGDVMNAITVVTMVFLPSTFVCTVFSMGFFDYDFENANGRIRVSQDGWIFLAVAVPLTIITLGLSWIWMRFTLGSQGAQPQDMHSQPVKYDSASL